MCLLVDIEGAGEGSPSFQTRWPRAFSKSSRNRALVHPRAAVHDFPAFAWMKTKSRTSSSFVTSTW